MCDPHTHSKTPDVDFESRKSPAHEASWKKTKIANLNLNSDMTGLPVAVGLIEDNLSNPSLQALLHVVTDRARVLCDDNTSGRPIPAKVQAPQDNVNTY